MRRQSLDRQEARRASGGDRAYAAAGEPVRRADAIVALAIFLIATASGSGDKSVMALLSEPVRHDLKLTDYQMAMVQGTSGGLAFLLASIPFGLWVDRGNRILIAFVGALLWSVGTIATAFAHDFVPLFMARLMVGLGAVTINPVGLSLISDWFEPRQRGMALGVFAAAAPIATAIGSGVGGVLFGAYSRHTFAPFLGMTTPWRSINFVYGVVALASAIGLLFVREPVRREQLHADTRFATHVRELWARRAFFVPLVIGITASLAIFFSVMIWTPTALERLYGQTPDQFGVWWSIEVLLVGVAGSLLGGAIASKIVERATRGLMIGGAVLSLAALPGAMFGLAPTPAPFALGVGFVLLTNSAARTLVTTALTTGLPNQLRGLAMGADTFVAVSFGLGCSPLLVGGISNSLGPMHNAIGIAFALICVPASVISAAFFFAAGRLRGSLETL